MKKSAIIPLSILGLMIGGILLLGKIGRKINERIINEGIDGVCTVFDEKSRMIKIRYFVNGIEYTKGVGKGHSKIYDGEQFMIKYLPQNPESVVVLWHKPYLSDRYKYAETQCVSMSKTMSIIYFTYRVNGKMYKRNALYRDHSINSSDYIVKYRVNDPKVGYLFSKKEMSIKALSE